MNCKEKLEEAKRLYKSANDDQKYVLENLFPELKEDEKIKKQIISFLKEFERDHYRNLDFSSWIDWLEKQDKQKTADEVKPKKFKVGDWVIGGATWNKPRQIAEIRKDGYITTYGGWIGSSFEDDMHLWSIQDAKDGDILVTEYKNIFIFKSINDCTVYDYCGLYFGKFSENSGPVNGNAATQLPKGYTPATKEQRKTLFAKMKEAGYEWDAEKKELKKIVVPIFHIGDWIITPNNATKQIKRVTFGNYHFTDETFYNIIDTDNKGHLWTIEDAKDGDVLADKYNNIGIFQECEGMCWHSYIYLGCDGELRGFSIGGSHKQNDSCPATKEQCDLLFQKIKEAGYRWDEEKKELKKINTYCQENCKGFQETGRCFTDGECKAKKEAEQKSAWSEEDEKRRKNVLRLITEANDRYIKEQSRSPFSADILWLKSLPERFVFQPKQEWNEEDERTYKSIIYAFEHRFPLIREQQNFVKSLKDRVQPQPKQKWSEEDEKMFSELLSSLLINASDQWVKYGKWLKTLKERITWKPTEAQLASLTIACDRNDRIGFDLTQLLTELKKL